MKIVLLGIQGSGKSTQGNLLSQKLHVPYLSTGHIFRLLAQEKTRVGRYIKEVMTAGYLIPDRKTITIVNNYLAREEYKKGYILDGFPRTLVQAKSFKENIDKVIFIRVRKEEALRRLSLRNGEEARPDDTTRAIQKRIELFYKLTEPVLDYYRECGLLVEIDGERTIEEIHNDIMRRIQ